MIRVVLDSNVIISALVFGGKPRRLFNLILEGRYVLYISKEIIDEVTAILTLKFNYPQDALFAIESELRSLAIITEPGFKIDHIKNDQGDNRILECAKAGECQYVISGDKHLLSANKFERIEIMTVSDFLSLMLNE